MSDTRKTWDDLIANFPDNEQRLIDAVHVREFVATVKPHVAARAPTVTDDITQGFDVGRDWIYETSPVEFYKCESAAQGAAVWRKTYPVDAPGGAGTWGSISGSIDSQTDLVAALAEKADVDHSQDMETVNGLAAALAEKSEVGHTHDERYYTETEVDNIVDGIEASLSEVEASEVQYDNTASGLTAIDAQSAIDEIADDLDALEAASGLTNPLVADLVGAGYQVQDVVYRGFQDIFYDLDADPDTLVDTGVATLVDTHNAYTYAGLDSALTIEFPAEPVGLLAPFGIISINLATGGSVALDDTVPFVWSKASLSDADPELPNEADDTFAIRYRWEPLISAYVLGLEILPEVDAEEPEPEPEPGSVSIVNFAISALSAINRDVHSYTYNYVSTTQDGTVHVYVFFITDAQSSKAIDSSVYDSQLEQVAVTNNSNNAIWVGRIKPSQGNLDGDTLPLTFNYSDECAQIAVLEVSGAHATTPTSFSNVTTVSSDTTIGPMSITSGEAGTLLISAAIVDENKDIGVSNLNSFTQHVLGATSSALGGYAIHTRIVDAAGSVNSPTYTGSAADRMNMVVLAVAPAA